MKKQYYPILRIQRGECDALSKLEPKILSGITPIWELPPIPQKPRKVGGGDKYSLDEHIRNCIEKLIPTLDESRTLLIDSFLFDTFIESTDASMKHTIEQIKEIALEHGIYFVPVINSEASQDAIDAANSVASEGLCFRVNAHQATPDTVAEMCDQLYQAFDTNYEKIHLIFDLKEVSQSNIIELQRKVPLILLQLDNLQSWKSISIASSSYPSSMAGFEKHKTVTKPMLEVDLWKKIFSHKGLQRMPSYGDYALAPAKIDYGTPVEFMNPSATIRYSSHEYWVFVKGNQVKGKGGKKGPGWGQTKELCQILIDNPIYKQYGPTFSEGDKYIAARTTGDVSSGAGYTWRDVGTNHHVTMISKYLSS